jgi:predicted GNAT superfamily acetyltransferase
VAQAIETAQAAARRAGVAVRMLTEPAEAHAADRLLASIWDTAGTGSPVSSHLMRALAHSGNYVAGAWAGQELAGASVAFFALQEGSLSLHSHVTGVATQFRGSHIGLALKLHQRAWVLERDMDEIGWSFDPLIRRNGWFNLRKLRAVVVGYEPDFYGPMADGINAGDESDRCLVRWKLTAPAVVGLLEGDQDAAEPTAPTLVDEDTHGYPIVLSPVDVQDGSVWLCRVPADVEGWRLKQPDRARAWRLALRRTLGTAMAAGFVAGTMTRDGCYVLTRQPGPVDIGTGESSQ